MDFELSARDRDIQERARRLARGSIAEHADEWDRSGTLSREANQLLADAGLLHLLTESGAGHPGPATALVIIREELAAISAHVDSLFAVQGLAAHALLLAGSSEMRERYLPGVSGGALIGAFALTEPQAGSDTGAIATVARRDGRGWLVDGAKEFISHAGFADYYVVFARLEAPDGELAALVIDAENPGLRAGPVPELIAPHILGTLMFSACRVDDGALLRGAPGQRVLADTLETFRPSVGAAAVGMARTALDETLRFTSQRRQFGRAISDFQATRFTLAEMATRLEAARRLTHLAAWALDTNQREKRLYSSMAKLEATEAAGWIIDKAVQLHGARGLQRGTRVEQLFREERALRIYEGTSEIQHLIIASELRALRQDSA